MHSTHRHLAACAVAGLLALAYYANGVLGVSGNDARASTYLAAALVERGSVEFTPQEYPFMFVWQRRDGGDWVRDGDVDGWNVRARGTSQSYGELHAQGDLRAPRPKYYLVRGVDRTGDGNPVYVNAYGVGAALAAVPAFAAARLYAGADLRADPAMLWAASKLAAVLLVAGSAAFVLLSACLFTTVPRAALIALAYGLGTSVWSTSSQALWQHAPNAFFLALGLYCLLRARDHWGFAASSGLALALATACRPNSALVALVAAASLLALPREARARAFGSFCAAAAPVALALAAYNHAYLGDPFAFGQAASGAMLARRSTGIDDLWSTPFLMGAAGVLISPSRGLLVYSPVLVFAFVGLLRVWRDARYRALRPASIALLALLLPSFKWFSWWGGWSYGPRLVVDTMPFFALMLIPVIDDVFSRKNIRIAFAALFLWSAAVQAIGAFAYDIVSWNNLTVGFRVETEQRGSVFVRTTRDVERLQQISPGARVTEVTLDVDAPAWRHRLWGIHDSQILYYLMNFTQSRATRAYVLQEMLRPAS